MKQSEIKINHIYRYGLKGTTMVKVLDKDWNTVTYYVIPDLRHNRRIPLRDFAYYAQEDMGEDAE